MKEFFRKLFCRHDYKKVCYRQEVDYKSGIRYALRYYTCKNVVRQFWLIADMIHTQKDNFISW